MDITLKRFYLNKTKDKKKYYISLHNTVTTQYAGVVRKVVLCNLTEEGKKIIDSHPGSVFIEEANGFMSLTLINTRPSIVLVLNDLKVSEVLKNE